MKRSMDLIRDLLLKLETLPLKADGVAIFNGQSAELAIAGWSAEEIFYHLMLIREAGFIESPGTQLSGLGVNFRRLSWSGHDFLDSVRDPKIWSQTKNGAEAAGGFTAELLKDLAKGFVKKQIEEYTGIKL